MFKRLWLVFAGALLLGGQPGHGRHLVGVVGQPRHRRARGRSRSTARRRLRASRPTSKR